MVDDDCECDCVGVVDVVECGIGERRSRRRSVAVDVG